MEIVQYRHLRTQIPALYALVSLNALVVSVAFFPLAPRLVSVVMPGLLITVCMVRLVRWLHPLAPGQLTAEFARQQIARIDVYAAIMGVFFSIWAILLDLYGGMEGHGYVVIFVAITMLGGMTCMAYAPRGALIICGIVLGTFVPFTLWHCTLPEKAVALNVALACALTLKVQFAGFATFVRLETSKQELHSERVAAQQLGEENARLAHTDVLTALPNRRHFFGQLDLLLNEAGPGSCFAIAVFDLDRFKPVNDTLGHAVGDRLLAEIGDRLRQFDSAGLTIARLGGDEFGAIIEAKASSGDPAGDHATLAESICARICEAIQQPVALGEHRVCVGCSAGLSLYPENGMAAHDLFDRADFALYHAKRHRRGGVVRFSTALEQMIRSEQAIEAALQAADLPRELTLAYQPIVAARSHRLVGVEALARWDSPVVGPVPPEMLIATAERLGMARAVTLALFDRAMADFDMLPHPLRLSFNLSAADLADRGTVDGLVRRMQARSPEPGRIVFEIIETSLIADFEAVRAVLERLRQHGAGIALDDFGTGYSSLSALHQLHIDVLKIDRSFAARLGDPAGRRLMSAVRNLAAALDVECVFEGIENEAQLIEATLAGFHYVQGFFLARPDRLETTLRFALGQEDRASAAG